MTHSKDFDLIVYGASGYTGRLVADYLNRTYGQGSEVRWAMAGRNGDKLAAVRDEIGAPGDTPLLTADAADPDGLIALAQKAACVITTVGPYSTYGMPLIAACAKAGTDYVDLCGEPLWMAETIGALNDTAKASGARLVHSCGFDSIPTDLGVWTLQQEAIKTFGTPCDRVRGRVRAMKGTFSGGTAASMKATMAALFANKELKDVLFNPFALCEGFQGPRQPSGAKPVEDEILGSWAAPFIMATINTKNLHRSNYLMGHPYGEDLVYDEMILTGPGDQGKAVAEHIASAGMGKDAERQPGEGPTEEERETGHFDILFHGTHAAGGTVRAAVTGDKDPGYGATCKMLSESALCLVEDVPGGPGGVLTPVAAMAAPLRDRLAAKAGMTFPIEGVSPS